MVLQWLFDIKSHLTFNPTDKVPFLISCRDRTQEVRSLSIRQPDYFSSIATLHSSAHFSTFGHLSHGQGNVTMTCLDIFDEVKILVHVRSPYLQSSHILLVNKKKHSCASAERSPYWTIFCKSRYQHSPYSGYFYGWLATNTDVSSLEIITIFCGNASGRA